MCTCSCTIPYVYLHLHSYWKYISSSNNSKSTNITVNDKLQDKHNACSIHGTSSLPLRSRASTLRSPKRPMGRPDSEAVRNGNILACRCFILLLVASCKGCWWIMEQPSTSCMEYMPCFQQLMRLIDVHKLNMCMADYGSPTVKRTSLYSSTLGGHI